ncbi:MAG: tetratricopeptide repeat protein [Bacteroidia bacterium]|nr:MAG: tetratricopeptide repeat protein [Bacteroidia bacterium]
MSNNPDKIVQFWQELKRRKVVRVITVYAAAAFVILELVSIIVEPLGLPEWTLQFAIVFLCIGFIIAVILSWIYDVHPEGGIVKTEPAHRAKAEDQPASSNSLKIASYISFLVIVAFVVFYFVGNNKKSFDISKLEKSIAVLPLDYLSEDPNKEYLANGVLDAITGHLSMIEGLRVMPRTSVEQYRENKKSAKEIGEELDVSYLIEGSFLMIEDQVKLTIKVVVAKEGDNVFFKEYDINYKDIIAVQSKLVQTIAKEIEVAITPQEKQLIEKLPTSDLTAYEYWIRGNDEILNFWLDKNNIEALDRAESLYFTALKYDSAYAQAYAGLASVYWNKQYENEYFSENFLDSAVILIDKALSYDKDLALAHKLKGDYFYETGQPENALNEYERALELNPNDWVVYMGIGTLYFQDDFTLTLMNYHKAASLNRGKGLSQIYHLIARAYRNAGFIEKSGYYEEQALTLDGDSVQYLRGISGAMYNTRNYEEAIENLKKAYGMDTSFLDLLIDLGADYLFLGNYKEALVTYEKYINDKKKYREIEGNNMHRIAYAYSVNGYKEEANYYFDKQLEYSKAEIELSRSKANLYLPYYDIAGIFAFREKKEKAYENLRIFNKKERQTFWMVNLIKNDPLFNSIRDEPEFQQIVRDVEAKYQAEHERVRQWLEENDML